MNTSFKSVCPNCQIESSAELLECSYCEISNESEELGYSFKEIEPMPVELRVVVLPIAFFLFLFGIPLALIAGISLSQTQKVRCLGALILVVVMLGTFGAGVQLIAFAMAVAFTLV